MAPPAATEEGTVASNPISGQVTRAFEDWRWIERDQRAFLEVGLRFAKEMYTRLWEEAGREPWYEGGPEQLESFEDKVDGLWEADFEWMHCAAVLKDAVTGFEVYLEKAREEIRDSDGEREPPPDHAPSWGTLRSFFVERIGVDPQTPEVRRIRDLRHLLTHRRGELRTEELRARFAAESEVFRPIAVELSAAVVIAALDDLATAARMVDAAILESV